MEEMNARDKRRKDLRDVVAKERIARTPSPRKGRGSPAGSPGSGFFSPRKRGTRGADGGKSPLKPKRL